MNTWKITKKVGITKNRKTRHKHPSLCDCGQIAVAKARVVVGLKPRYLVTLYLCTECLELERSSEPASALLSITMLI